MEAVCAFLYELVPCRPQDVVKIGVYIRDNSRDVFRAIYRGVRALPSSLTTYQWASLTAWAAGFYASISFNFAQIFLIISIVAMMLTNLSKRERGTLSAYSVFNEGFQRLQGAFEENLERDMVAMNLLRRDE